MILKIAETVPGLRSSSFSGPCIKPDFVQVHNSIDGETGHIFTFSVFTPV